jgi:hypothetical protein
MMIKVARKPPALEAVLFDGKNMEEIAGWLGRPCRMDGERLVIGTPGGDLVVCPHDVVTRDEGGGLRRWDRESFGRLFGPLEQGEWFMKSYLYNPRLEELLKKDEEIMRAWVRKRCKWTVNS